MNEIAFETMLGALESTRGTAISAPTHLLNVTGTMDSDEVRKRPVERRGVRAMHQSSRSKRTKNETTIGFSGDLDINEILFWLAGAVQPSVSPTTPTNGVLTRLWTHTRLMATDTEKALSLWWGDPNVQSFRTAFNMLEEIVIENDAQSDDGIATISGKLRGQPREAVSDPTVPASIAGDTLPGGAMQLWVDSGADAIGTTPVTGRFLHSKLTIPTGRTFKRVAAGTGSTKSFTHVGVKPTNPVLEITLEVPDLTQYNQWSAETELKVRVQHNGALIESVTPDYYNYLNHDTYGPFEGFVWAENQASNRTITLVIQGQYHATPASDLIVRVQNARTSI